MILSRWFLEHLLCLAHTYVPTMASAFCVCDSKQHQKEVRVVPSPVSFQLNACSFFRFCAAHSEWSRGSGPSATSPTLGMVCIPRTTRRSCGCLLTRCTLAPSGSTVWCPPSKFDKFTPLEVQLGLTQHDRCRTNAGRERKVTEKKVKEKSL